MRQRRWGVEGAAEKHHTIEFPLPQRETLVDSRCEERLLPVEGVWLGMKKESSSLFVGKEWFVYVYFLLRVKIRCGFYQGSRGR
jgi:hypothetical protein